MLGKFRDLLNEKKSKIRDQQRVLSSATVDPEKLAAVQAASKAEKGRGAGTSRTRKRKGRVEHVPEGTVSDSSSERMDVDVPGNADDTEEEGLNTPEALEDETADEDDGDDNEAKSPVGMSTRHVTRSKKSLVAAGRAKSHTAVKGTTGHKGANTQPVGDGALLDSAATTEKTKKDEQGSISQAERRAGRSKQDQGPPTTPPRRDLPFAKKAIISAPAHDYDLNPSDEVPADDGEETVSEDDLDDEL